MSWAGCARFISGWAGRGGSFSVTEAVEPLSVSLREMLLSGISFLQSNAILSAYQLADDEPLRLRL